MSVTLSDTTVHHWSVLHTTINLLSIRDSQQLIVLTSLQRGIRVIGLQYNFQIFALFSTCAGDVNKPPSNRISLVGSTRLFDNRFVTPVDYLKRINDDDDDDNDETISSISSITKS